MTSFKNKIHKIDISVKIRKPDIFPMDNGLKTQYRAKIGNAIDN